MIMIDLIMSSIFLSCLLFAYRIVSNYTSCQEILSCRDKVRSSLHRLFLLTESLLPHKFMIFYKF